MPLDPGYGPIVATSAGPTVVGAVVGISEAEPKSEQEFDPGPQHGPELEPEPEPEPEPVQGLEPLPVPEPEGVGICVGENEHEAFICRAMPKGSG